MTPQIAELLIPLVRDIIDNERDDYYYGCLVGACDVMECLGLITEADYGFVVDAADRAPDELLAVLFDASIPNDSPQEVVHAG
jgi:hypothetical protein